MAMGRKSKVFIVTAFFAVIMAILMFVAIAKFVKEDKKSNTYLPSQCLVAGQNVYQDTCTYRTCRKTSSGSKHCTTHTYTCWGGNWEVTYRAARGNVTGYIDAGKKKDEYSSMAQYLLERPIGKTYSCYYDSTNTEVAQWNKPNPLAWEIVLIISTIYVGVFCIATAIACFANRYSKYMMLD